MAVKAAGLKTLGLEHDSITNVINTNVQHNKHKYEELVKEARAAFS